MRPRHRPSGMFVLAVVMALLLGGLAVLQYRWVGQLSADERERIKDHLKDSADEFAEDFDRELTRAFFWLQMGPEIRRDEEPDPDPVRYERWFQAAEHPELIAAIYQVDLDDKGEPTLYQFFRNQPRLEPASWPAALEPVHKAIRERQAAAASASAPPVLPGPPPGAGATVGLSRVPPVRIPLLWPDISAIVAPRVRVVATSGPPPSDGPTRHLATMPPLPNGYIIAMLNQQYLRQSLIPRLIDRHFVKGPDGALHVAVKAANEVVYSTPGALPKVLQHADAKESLWEIRFFEASRFVTERRPIEPPGVAGERRDPAPDSRGDRERDGERGNGRHGGDGHRDGDGHRGGVEHRISREIATKAAVPAPGTQTNIMVMYRGDERMRMAFRGPITGQPQWHVHVLHGAGSLDAAVARARWRNLLISFGVLLLLGTSMGLVLISSTRARRLAAQQMEFVAGVSHELRTPLAVIRSAAENLADGIVDDGPGVRRYGQLIAGEGRRLTQMVEQVMTFAGLQAGRPGFDVRPIDVGPVVDDALLAVAHVAREQGAEIETHIDADLPRIMADPSAVGRALQNLIANALKYGGDPAQIRVSAQLASQLPGNANLEVTATRRGVPRLRSMVNLASREEVAISVTDRGPGIAPRDLPHIFEPFYRGADAVSRQIHGSGLGLSLVQRIMQELGGRVTVTTGPSQGSTFTLHLPVAPETEAVAHASGAPIPHSSS